MDALIKHTQEIWKEAKKAAETACRRQNDERMAAALSQCQMFTGEETLEEMVALMFSARGAEFLTRFGFPSLDIFRQYKPLKPEHLGVWIDSGKTDITGQNRVFLVGGTDATVRFCDTDLCRVVLMHGAKAVIILDGYAVLNVESDSTSSYSVIKNGHSVLL